jgi:hypothetical protein
MSLLYSPNPPPIHLSPLQLQVLSVEIAGINLPAEYLDPETGRCCVLLGHLGDPDIPRGFNVTVPHQHQWILQSVLFVPARVVPYAQCMAIRKDGAEARRKVAEEFLKNKSYSINDIPPALWPVTNTAKVDAPTTATPAAPAPAPATHGSSTTSSSGSSISKPP